LNFGFIFAAMIAAKMFFVGIDLTKFARDVRPGRDLIPLLLTVTVSLLANMAVGFAAGLAAHYSLNFRDRQRNVRQE